MFPSELAQSGAWGAASLIERHLPVCATVPNVIDDAPELAMRFVTTGGPEGKVQGATGGERQPLAIG